MNGAGRKTIPALALAAAALLIAATAAFGAAFVGTDRGDILTGTQRADEIVGRGGSDTIEGRGGPDKLLGGSGNDRITGGAGKDEFYGGAGNDTIDSRDGKRNERIDCGPGRDTVMTDGETTFDCEREIVVIDTDPTPGTLDPIEADPGDVVP